MSIYLDFLDTSEDGHNVTNSELYLFDIQTSQSKRSIKYRSVIRNVSKFHQ